jgi:hypothetical protein
MAAALSPPPGIHVRRPIGPRLIGGAALIALAAGIWWASHQQLTATRKTAEDSVLIPIVPPPPPPPPVDQPRPEPRPEEVPPQPVNQPQPTPQQPTPAQPLAAAPSAGSAVSIDGPPQAGGDGFNIGSGPGGGVTGAGRIGTGIGGFNRTAYASYLEGEFRRAIEREAGLRSASLRAKVRVWIEPSGRITLVEASGIDADKADAIRSALAGRTVRAPDASLAMPVALTLDIRRGG